MLFSSYLIIKFNRTLVLFRSKIISALFLISLPNSQIYQTSFRELFLMMALFLKMTIWALYQNLEMMGRNRSVISSKAALVFPSETGNHDINFSLEECKGVRPLISFISSYWVEWRNEALELVWRCLLQARGLWMSCLSLHVCLLTHFSGVWLFATPWTAVRQAALSLWILQARILEWIAMPSSRGSSWPRDQTHVSCTAGGFFTTEPPRKPLPQFTHLQNGVEFEFTL